ncbi:MAG: response regulator [Gracilimonas sp.]|nr:response regulator [Gracilimonas sp.]
MKNDIQLSEMVETLSHELRTPLNAILGYSELLSKSQNMTDDQMSHISNISKGGQQLLHIINDIIELSNIETGKVKLQSEVIEANSMVEGIINEFKSIASIKEIDFIINSSSINGRSFIGDKNKINTVLFILLNNAFKFTEEGKVVLDMLYADESPEKLNIKLKDTGIGITKEELDHIFQPLRFVDTTSQAHKGFGMATCKKLVSLMGGNIRMKSEVEKGTIVDISIPIKQSTMSLVKQDDKFTVIGNAPKSPKALIVDDLVINRKLARIMLETRNFKTFEAENGKEAIQVFNDDKPDVVLMDISMPVMNGVDAMRQIRELNHTEHSTTPIIAITAGGHAGSRSELMEKGFSEYIQKPFREEELIRKISMFMPVPEQNLNAVSEA